MTNDQQEARRATVTTPTEREIHVERIFDAPRDRVFELFTDPELIPEWWGPRGTTTIVDEMDVRNGGSWRYVTRNSDGSETAFRGTYREVSPPDRIVQTFEWEGMPGHVSVDTAVFEDLGERTKLVSSSIFHTTEERDGMLGSGMEDGHERDLPAFRRADREARLALTGPGWSSPATARPSSPAWTATITTSASASTSSSIAWTCAWETNRSRRSR